MTSRVVLNAEEKRRTAPPAGSPEKAWRGLGWFGLLLSVVGLGDVVIAWFPLGIGSPEWEFATVSSSFSSLPLVSMGLAGIFGAAMATGSRWLLWVISLTLVVMSLLVLGALGLFLTDVPIALRAAPAEVGIGIRKAVIKTIMLGVGFASAYALGAVAVFRHLGSRRGAYERG